MKFAVSLIAMGASAVKLALEDEAHPVQNMLDSNDDGVIQKGELMDQVYAFEAMGYLDEEFADEFIEIYSSDDFPAEFTFDDFWNLAEASGNEEFGEGWAKYIELSENVALDIAANVMFEMLDVDGDEEVAFSEAENFFE